MTDIMDPSFIDSSHRVACRHLREPDRGARGGRHDRWWPQGCPQPGDRRGRAGGARRHRGSWRDPSPLDDRAPRPTRATASALDRGVLRRCRRAEHLGAALDFFCLPHGRTAPFASALVAVNEGRGFNSTIPMPFAHHVRRRARERIGRTDRPVLPGRLHAGASHACRKRVSPRLVPPGESDAVGFRPGHHRRAWSGRGAISDAASGSGSSTRASGTERGR